MNLTQRSESDDSINLDEKKTRQKNPVKDYDSLTGISKDNGSTVSESHVTKSTFGVDDESIVGRGKRNRKKKKDPEFEYFKWENQIMLANEKETKTNLMLSQ